MNDQIHREWDETSLKIHRSLLEDARNGSTRLNVVALVLIMADGRRRVVTYVAEYGDDDGSSSMDELAKAMHRQGLLQPGERLVLEMREAPNQTDN